MGVCREYKIPHSELLRRWTADDRDKAIWDQLRRAQTCQSCGTHPDDWDPDKGGDRRAYVAVVRRCAGCAALEQKQAEHGADPDKGKGESVQLKRREAHGGVDQGQRRGLAGVQGSTAPAAGGG